MATRASPRNPSEAAMVPKCFLITSSFKKTPLYCRHRNSKCDLDPVSYFCVLRKAILLLQTLKRFTSLPVAFDSTIDSRSKQTNKQSQFPWSKCNNTYEYPRPSAKVQNFSEKFRLYQFSECPSHCLTVKQDTLQLTRQQSLFLNSGHIGGS